MKNYYFNPKTQDLHIFDPETKEMLVLERIEGIRVLTTSEIDRPVREDTSMLSMSLSPGTVLNLGWHSTNQWFCGIGFTWRSAALRPGRSTCEWRPCGGWLTRRLTPDY